MTITAGSAVAAASTGWFSPGLLFTSAVLAALLTALVNIVLARRNSREEERARIRTTFAEAYGAYCDYREFPYAIRRRNPDQRAAERIRLSEQLRAVQSKLNFYIAWTAAESTAVGVVFAALVTELRRVAGSAMHDAWAAEPVADDAGMNIGPGVIDLSSLSPLETAYTAAVAAHLRTLTPWWSR
jgi:hypothetical protein